jgi:MYXO-CTERM domain-containing protein
MIRTLCLLAVGLALAVVAFGGTTSCAGTWSTVGCPQLDVIFQNDPAIPVNNFSFETPGLPPGDFTSGAIPSWTLSGTGQEGVDYPNAGYFSTAVPNGNQAAYIYLPGAGESSLISQDVGALIANATYSLTGLVGLDSQNPAPASYDIELYGSTSLTDYTAVAPVCTAPSAGTFLSCTVTFDSAIFGSQVGTNDIVIGLVGSGGNGGGEVYFDNVQLGYTSDSPEPGTIGLGLLGLGALGLKRWHGRRSNPSEAR